MSKILKDLVSYYTEVILITSSGFDYKQHRKSHKVVYNKTKYSKNIRIKK